MDNDEGLLDGHFEHMQSTFEEVSLDAGSSWSDESLPAHYEGFETGCAHLSEVRIRRKEGNLHDGNLPGLPSDSSTVHAYIKSKDLSWADDAKKCGSTSPECFSQSKI
jgi:hypothetical protein